MHIHRNANALLRHRDLAFVQKLVSFVFILFTTKYVELARSRLKFGLAPFAAALLVTAVAAQEPTLSPGQKFAEQGGAAIYANVCAACHQVDAKGAVGAAAYPALAANGRLASADYVLRIVIRGQRDMPPLGGMMSDEQVAHVVNYIRSHFGNDYRDTVSAAAVHAARPPPGP